MFDQPSGDHVEKPDLKNFQKIEQSLKEDNNKYPRRTREDSNNISQERVQSRPLIVFDWPA